MLGLSFGFGKKGSKTLISREKFRGHEDHNYKTSTAMKQLMADKKVEALLHLPKEKQAFFKELEKYGRDKRGLTVDDMRTVLGTFRNKANDSIDRKEATRLAERLIPSSYKKDKRFLSPGQGPSVNPPAKKSGSSLFPF